MVRRASSRPNPWLLAGLGLAVAAAMAGGYFAFGFVQDPFRALQPLDLPAYLDNSQSLRGNVYRVEGSIQHALSWVPSQGRLISVETGEERDRQFLAVWVPTTFNHITVQKNQRYRFKVEVMNNGVLKVLDMSKS